MEEISAFLWRESLHDAANSAQQAANGAFSRLAQMRLQFAEGHLDGIEVGRVGRQINQCGTRRFDRLSDAATLWTGKLSIMTISPRLRVGTRYCFT